MQIAGFALITRPRVIIRQDTAATIVSTWNHAPCEPLDNGGAISCDEANETVVQARRRDKRQRRQRRRNYWSKQVRMFIIRNLCLALKSRVPWWWWTRRKSKSWQDFFKFMEIFKPCTKLCGRPWCRKRCMCGISLISYWHVYLYRYIYHQSISR